MNIREPAWVFAIFLLATACGTGSESLDDALPVSQVANLMTLPDHARDEGGSLRLVTTRPQLSWSL